MQSSYLSSVSEQWFHSRYGNSRGRITRLHLSNVQTGGVVDIPEQIRSRQIASSIAFLGQMQHKQPIPYSIFHGVTKWDFIPQSSKAHPQLNATLRCFAKAGFRWIVVHHHGQIMQPKV